jgi:hypothetical protein
MAAKNKYVLRSKISEAKFGQFAGSFGVAPNAARMVQAMGLNRGAANRVNGANRIAQGVRERMAAACAIVFLGPGAARGRRPENRKMPCSSLA